MKEAQQAARGHRVGYVRVSSVDQNTDRQLAGIELDRVFTDQCSGKDTNRPQLQAALEYLREGDELLVHSMDRLARNLDDMRRLVRELTERGVKVRFEKESLVFSGDDSPMNQLLLTLLGAVAEFERAMIRERQREGIALAKERKAFKGRRPTLTDAQVVALQEKVAAGASKVAVAREFSISRQTLYEYLKKPLPDGAGRVDMAHRQALEKRGQGKLL